MLNQNNDKLIDFITKNEPIIHQMVQYGLLSFTIIRDIEIYKKWKEIKLNETSKYLILANDYELSTRQVQRIINNMNKDI
ncbi:hypothetical protein [Galbibacter pacificus]|uniref:hypothetical protein n=1 Tax=Galbibacter pacificus TaxID=2996052 RepID=UPI002412C4B5|nr:hypothetical protein [Galbibacter pacificus]